MARRDEGAAISTKQLLLEVLDCAFDRAAWHGANLMGAIRGVTAAAAGKRVKGRKSIWEQVLHAAYWKQRVLNKLMGTSRFPRKGSNWPKAPQEETEAAWREDVALLRELHRRLREAVAGVDERKLDYVTRRLIHGAAGHDIYHAGQIKLMRRLLG